MTYDKILRPGEEIQLIVEQNRKIFIFFFIAVLYLPLFALLLEDQTKTFIVTVGILFPILITFAISNIFRKGMLITNIRVISVGLYKIQEMELNQLKNFKAGFKNPFFDARTIAFIGEKNTIFFPCVKNYSLIKEKLEEILLTK